MSRSIESEKQEFCSSKALDFSLRLKIYRDTYKLVSVIPQDPANDMVNEIKKYTCPWGNNFVMSVINRHGIDQIEDNLQEAMNLQDLSRYNTFCNTSTSWKDIISKKMKEPFNFFRS